jgi:signal transduction histidine kinase/CheY-like chemotaxis protein/HAMP domain-containing protein
MTRSSAFALRFRLLATAGTVFIASFTAIYFLSRNFLFSADESSRASLLLALPAVLALGALWAGVELLILRPARALQQTLEQLSEGDVNSRPNPAFRQGEIGALAQVSHQLNALLESERDKHRLAEQRLIESGQLNRVILSSLPARVAILDRDGNIVAVNEAWKRVVGNGAMAGQSSGRTGTLEGANYLEVCRNAMIGEPPESEQARGALIGIAAVLSGEKSEFRMEYSCPLPDEMCWFLMIATPLPIDTGGAVVTHLDITERKRDEEQRRLLETQLFQAQRMESIGTLAGGIAHDFNNILTAIIGNIQLLRRRLDPGNRAFEYLRDIDSAASRAAALTRQLLSFSRRQQLERTVVNVNEMISNLMSMLRRIIGEDIEISVITDPELPPIFADLSQIEQVMVNLAVNARDAMPGGGQMVIETRQVTLDETHHQSHPWIRLGAYVQIAVTDSGCGMDAETQHRAFEPFFTTKGPGEGTGLGLSVAYGIVKQHDGFVHLYSEPGVGTTFRIYLPVAGAGVETAAPEKGNQELIGGTETILVAEDEDSLRKLAYDVLTGLGYKALLAGNGVEALEIYKAHRDQVALLLLDIVMPRQGGRATFEAIRELGSDVPVIFMTGYSAEIARSHFIATSGASILQKPYTPDSLGLKVREILDEASGKKSSSASQSAIPNNH